MRCCVRTDVPAHATPWKRTRPTLKWASHWRRDGVRNQPAAIRAAGQVVDGRLTVACSTSRVRKETDVASSGQAQNAVATERFCARDRQRGRTQPQSRGLDASNAHSLWTETELPSHVRLH
jgi:hypothetical protein